MIFNVPQDQLIEKTAEELKKLIHMPSWALFVKTGAHKEKPPVDNDWWYIRSAAVLRKVYFLGPIGVSKLRIKYGGKRNRGYKPEKFYKGSGSIIRKVLQQLEEAKLVKQETIGKHKGRVITPKGTSVLFSVAKRMGGYVPKKKPAPKKGAKPEVKKPVEKKAEPPKAKEKPHVIPKEKQLLSTPKAKKKETPKKKETKKEVKKEISETKVSDDAQKPKVSDTPKKEKPKEEKKAPKKEKKK